MRRRTASIRRVQAPTIEVLENDFGLTIIPSIDKRKSGFEINQFCLSVADVHKGYKVIPSRNI